jgi:hypothetical protein
MAPPATWPGSEQWRFPTYPKRAYNEITPITISIWYNRNLMCELEPTGPMEPIAPGESASFTESWWLLSRDFPQDRRKVNLEEVTSQVERLTR